jgi:hypothetical protein
MFTAVQLSSYGTSQLSDNVFVTVALMRATRIKLKVMFTAILK